MFRDTIELYSESCAGPGIYGGNIPWRNLLTLRGPDDSPNLHMERFNIRWAGSVVLANAGGGSENAIVTLMNLFQTWLFQVPTLPPVVQMALTKYVKDYLNSNFNVEPESLSSVGGAKLAFDSTLVTGKSVAIGASASVTLNFDLSIPLEWGAEHNACEDDFIHPVGIFRDTKMALNAGALTSLINAAASGADVTVTSLTSTLTYRVDMVALPWVQLSAWTAFDYFKFNSSNTKPTNIPLINAMCDSMWLTPDNDQANFAATDLVQMGLNIGQEVVVPIGTSTKSWLDRFNRGLYAGAGRPLIYWPNIGSGVLAYGQVLPIIAPSWTTRGQSLADNARFILNTLTFQFDAVSQNMALIRRARYVHSECATLILGLMGRSGSNINSQKSRNGRGANTNSFVTSVAPIKLTSSPISSSTADLAAQTTISPPPAVRGTNTAGIRRVINGKGKIKVQ